MNSGGAPGGHSDALPRRPRRRISARRRWIRNILLFVGGMLVPVGLCSTTVFECYRVDGDGMSPTLRAGDRVLAITAPLPKGRLPRRDSVVLLEAPSQSRRQSGLIVKRVSGLPGDTLHVRKGHLWRNGRLADEPYTAEAMQYKWGPLAVPGGHIAVLGDNRNQSDDSHNWRGISGENEQGAAPFVPMQSLRGRVIAVTWPLHRIGRVREG